MLTGDAPLTAVVLQVFPGGKIGIKAGGLHHGPGPGPGGLKLPLPRIAKKLYLSLTGQRLGGDHSNDGGLTRPIPAYQAVDLPLGDDNVGMIHHGGTAITFGQPSGDQHIFFHRYMTSLSLS